MVTLTTDPIDALTIEQVVDLCGKFLGYEGASWRLNRDTQLYVWMGKRLGIHEIVIGSDADLVIKLMTRAAELGHPLTLETPKPHYDFWRCADASSRKVEARAWTREYVSELPRACILNMCAALQLLKEAGDE